MDCVKNGEKLEETERDLNRKIDTKQWRGYWVNYIDSTASLKQSCIIRFVFVDTIKENPGNRREQVRGNRSTGCDEEIYASNETMATLVCLKWTLLFKCCFHILCDINLTIAH